MNSNWLHDHPQVPLVPSNSMGTHITPCLLCDIQSEMLARFLEHQYFRAGWIIDIEIIFHNGMLIRALHLGNILCFSRIFVG